MPCLTAEARTESLPPLKVDRNY